MRDVRSMTIGRPILAPPSTNLGWLFIVAVTLCTAGYVGGGIAYGKRSGATATPSSGDKLSILRVHPHFDRWLEFQGLAADGLRFARGGGGGGGGGGSASRTSHTSHHGGRGYGAVGNADGGNRDDDDKDRKRHRRSSKKKKEKSTQDVGEANSPRAGAKGSVRKNSNKEKQLVDAPVDVVAAPSPASSGGGRWVHVPN